MAQLYVLAFPNGKAYVGITNETVMERYAGHFRAAFLHNFPLRAGPRGGRARVT